MTVVVAAPIISCCSRGCLMEASETVFQKVALNVAVINSLDQAH